MNKILAVIPLLLLALAQQPLTGAPNKFAQQIAFDLGLVFEPCPTPRVGKGDTTLCAYTAKTFDEFSPLWNLYSSLLLSQLEGSVESAWVKTSTAYQTEFTWGPQHLQIFFEPGGAKNLLVFSQYAR